MRPLPLHGITVAACVSCNQAWAEKENRFIGILVRLVETEGSAGFLVEDRETVAAVARKIVYGVCLHAFGPTFRWRDVPGDVSISFEGPDLPALQRSDSQWHDFQPETLRYAVTYRAGGFDCTITVRKVFWITASSKKA